MSYSDIRFRLGAVSYLNSVPLLWGMLHGPQAAAVDLTFSVPSACARDVEAGRTDIGLVPVAEIARQDLEILPGVGIAAFGAVRSILLFAKKPWQEVKTLAADPSSRTSVRLADVILRERYGTRVQILRDELPILRDEPSLDAMLRRADAALIIGDPALRIEPEQQPYAWLDLAEEWKRLTALPFVFAAWAGKPGISTDALTALTTGSYRFGAGSLETIVQQEARNRNFSVDLTNRYLREHLHYEIGPAELAGWSTFLQLAGLPAAKVSA